MNIQAWRKGSKVYIVDTDAKRQCIIRADSTPMAKEMLGWALPDLSLKARQFGMKFRDVRDIGERLMAMVDASRWFRNRKQRTYASERGF